MAGANLQLAVEAAHMGAHGVVAHIELAGNAELAVLLGKKERRAGPGPAGRTVMCPTFICRSRKPKRRQVRRPDGVVLLK